jgi:hypothetical protein
MQWSNRVGAAAAEDSRCTLNAITRRNVCVSRNAFANMIASPDARLRMMKVSSFRHVSNAAAHRLHNVRVCRESCQGTVEALAEVAYPHTDRPRGRCDVDSVLHHLSGHECGPIVVYRTHSGRHVLLDGAHRLVAAEIAECNVMVLVIRDAPVDHGALLR